MISNQNQIIKQAKFTYSALCKAFETIEDQELKAIKNQGEIKTIKKYAYNDKNSPLISK